MTVTLATKLDVEQLVEAGFEMTPAYWASLRALAGRPLPLTLAQFRDKVMPGSTPGTARTRISYIRRELEGTGLRIERSTGYRLVKDN